jgi:hypothetical protein
MNKFATRLALIAVIGVLGSGSAAFAAHMQAGGSVDCRDPANARNPICMNLRPKTHHQGSTAPKTSPTPKPGPMISGPVNTGPTYTPPPRGTMTFGNPPPYSGLRNPQPDYHLSPNGYFNFTPYDRDQFHRRFRGFDFGFFMTPRFSITLGFHVPHYYYQTLRPVPRSIYRYYPWFRGYLFFVARNGDIVIVSPRTYRIVAIL